jgi:hypothetical protein
MTDQTDVPEKKKPRKRSRALARRGAEPVAPVTLDFGTGSGFELAQRRAIALAGSSVVPENFRGPLGSEGYCNTLIALELAHRLNYPVLLVMQNLTVVEGRTGWQGKFYIALVQSGTAFRDFKWEWRGEKSDSDYGARFIATRLSDGHLCEGQWVDVALAKAEGWWSKQKNGREYSKWPTMTEQMLVYRSAAFWTNQWNPGATLGLRSIDEVVDAMNVEDPTRTFAAPPPPTPGFAPAGVAIGPRVPDAVLPPERRPAPVDRTLEPGIDPASMGGDTFAPEKAIREAIARGAFNRALAAITSMPPSPLKEALKKEYSAAKTKAQTPPQP